MIIPCAPHAPMHAVQQPGNLSCLINQSTLNSFSFFFLRIFWVFSNVSQNALYVLQRPVSCLAVPLRRCGSARDGLWTFLRGLSLTRCYWGRDGHDLLGHSWKRRKGESSTSPQTKAAGTNNWQVPLETDQLICMGQISLAAPSKEMM